MRVYILDEQFNLIEAEGSVTEKAEAFDRFAAEFNKNRYSAERLPRLGYNKVGEVEISTIMLPFDHNYWSTEQNPIVFETMIFGGEHDQYQERYHTYHEAVQGHADTVKMVENKSPDNNDKYITL